MALRLLTDSGPSGHVPLPAEIVIEDRTGEPAVSNEVLALEGSVQLRELRSQATHLDLQASLAAALGGAEGQDRSITSYGTVYVVEASTWFSLVAPDQPFEPTIVVVKPQARHLSVPTSTSAKSDDQAPAVAETPAEELRRLTGLPPALLADLFEVSRTTFYNWMEGATPRDERFQHLVEVIAHVKDARQRLPPGTDLSSWLRTPISAGAKTPVDYLRERKFTVFRGLVLRSRSAASNLLSTPMPPALPARPMTRTERAASLERLSPRPRSDDDEE